MIRGLVRSSYFYDFLFLLLTVREEKLPFAIRVLLESAVRNSHVDPDFVKEEDVNKILDWGWF